MQNSTQGFRLSAQQKNIWTQQQSFGQVPFCSVTEVVIKGKLQEQVLRRALHSVAARHEILRTTFHRPPGIKTPFQVVSEPAELPLQTVDLSGSNAAAQQVNVKAEFEDDLRRTFDYERGPLVRVSLFKLAEDRHVLLLSAAAICADTYTLSNFVAEVASTYQHQLSGSALAGEPMQYADFAEWQNELLEGDDEPAREGRSFWEQLEAAASVGLPLPLERRTAERPEFRSQVVAIEFEPSVVADIQALTCKRNTSIEAVLFAGWQALVRRLTNRSDFVIFSLCDGRKLEDLQGALGPYAKHLPVRCHCDDVEFVEYLRRASLALSEGEDWQEYFDPSKYTDTLTESIAFEFFEQPNEIEVDGVTFSVTRQYECRSPFKLKLSCFHAVNSIRVELVYDAQLLDPETVERVAEYFQRLVAESSVCDSPERVQRRNTPQTNVCAAPGAIDILSADERHWLVVDLNRTASPFSATKCIHQLFEEQVAHTPDAVALICGDRKLTYEELNERSNQIGHLLRRRGVTANTRVGLCMERSAEAIVALLGILKAGGAYVPLNPEHPPARRALQLAESNASALITNGAANQSLDFAGELIDLERDRTLLLAEPETNLQANTNAGNLVYVIYTSGSTGIPKGVAVQHQGLVNYTEFIVQRLELKEPLHFATVSTITADLGNTCIFPALVSGGCLHIVSYDTAMEGELFAEYLRKHPIDVLKIVPSHLNALLASKPQGEVLPLKYLILGGEALSWDLVDRIGQAKGTCKVINHYGPTETTVGSLTFSVDPEQVAAYSFTAPIGRPIANTKVYILDRFLNPAPTGVAGELHIGGAGVAAGYLNQPQETAARFVSDPFSNEAGARLYRTGDLARYLPDGNVEFLGRVDHQVKVRGFRVELGEIEAILSQHPSVRQAVVITGTTGTGSAATAGSGKAGVAPASSSPAPNAASTNPQRLLAYIVSSVIKPPTTDELRGFLLQQLPDYMVPSVFVFLKALPLTPNGKIDRGALPAPDETRPDLQRLFVAPRTPVETELANIWAEFLKVNEVGIHDNFFELGGHSLLATQVVSRMRKAFNRNIPLRSLFESPTVAQLAEQIGDPTAADAERILAEIEHLSDAEAELLLESEKL